MGWLSTFGLTAQIAFRNLFASRLKTVIVGGIIFFGAFLVVLLGSLVDSIDHAMSRSVVGSVAGHIQVFLGGTWFNVIGVMQPVILDPGLDSTAFIGLPVAHRLFQTQPKIGRASCRERV